MTASPAHAQDTTHGPPLPAAPADSSRPHNPHDSAAAAVVADTVPVTVDSIARADSIKRSKKSQPDTSLSSYHPDTVTTKDPLAHAEQPPLLGAGERYYWDQRAMYSSGALTVADLLARVPGFTGFRSGWISTSMIGAYLGDAARVRVFLDGMELDPLDSRLRNTIDLSTIPIWTLEEVAAERGAGELRVYLRTWRVDRTTPYTEADIGTGGYETNAFLGLYGQRFKNGMSIQVGGQQYTDLGPYGGGGQQTSILARLGWARGPWSFDTFFERVQQGRDMETPLNVTTGQTVSALPIPDLESGRTNAYVRAAYGDPDRGFWAQAMASTMDYRETSNHEDSLAALSLGVPTDTVDTATSESQYLVTGGFTRWGIRFSGTERVRVYGGTSINSPSARASFESGPLALSMFVERDAPSAWPTESYPQRAFTVPVSTVEGQARLTPLPFLSLAAAASRQYSSGALNAPPTSTALRGEVGLHVLGVDVTGGLMTRDTAIVQGLSVYDTLYTPAAVGRVTGKYATVQGSLWHLLFGDVTMTDWGSMGPYRPQYDVRAEAYVFSELLKKFPRHDISIRIGGTFEYRTPVEFPRTDGGIDVTHVEEAFSSYVEIHILHAVVYWKDVNFNGFPYDIVPQFLMPRQLSFYGVRWHFWD